MVVLVASSWWGPPCASAEEAPDYQRDIRPILADHCFTCHGPDTAERQAGLRLDRSEPARTPLESGHTAIVPGQPAESELVRRIEATDPEIIMPPADAKRPLSDEHKQLLRRWIEASAPYDEHWAYEAPVRPSLPATRDPNWCRNALDHFVLAKLDSAGLRPSPEADRTTLIRRLALDLTGLPPAPDEVDRFLADDSPDAYERLVERYLASPHFGEKLAQDWLDLARFGDSSGYQDDGDRPNAPYRDYVIEAFNRNMPFDQFTIENLAGDLLPAATTAQKVASGFNRLHRHNEEGGSDPDEFQVVYAVDRTNTIATTWMGITLGCAQCHDHKYDPISQREYYQLYAFFNSLKGEVVISKAASPPQIRVPTREQEQQYAEVVRQIAELEQQKQEFESALSKHFDGWLDEQRQKIASSTPPPAGMGAVGGIIARSSHPAWYADGPWVHPLSLDHLITARGKLLMVRSVNNVVYVGHHSAGNEKPLTQIGIMAAEGPRFFASVILPSGSRLLSPPITGEHGIAYSWSYRYDPAGGLDDPADTDTTGEGELTLELVKEGSVVGTARIDLSAVDRAANGQLNAFGMCYPGERDADSPLELYIDDVEYLVSASGAPRQHDFNEDPQWSSSGNRENGHHFGFDATVSAAGGITKLSAAQILALAPDLKPSHIARLRELCAEEIVPGLRDVEVRLAETRQQQAGIESTMPLAFVWEELETPRAAYILKRGDYRQPGDSVDRNVPAVFPALPDGAPRDRLALARWLVSGRHPLTGRVAVNRLWKQCFGVGLVRTPEDFGVRGEPPTHPELLDWLATEFTDGGENPQRRQSACEMRGWDTKHLLRLIVTSSTYRQSAVVTAELRERDPGNRLLARGGRFRLSAEEIRDMALTASGLLARHIGGRSVYPYQPDHFYRDKEDDPGEWKWPLESGTQQYRRGLYTFIRRTTPYPSYQTFDAPSRGECTVARSRTNTPLQALVTMNDPTFVEAARVLGEQMASHEGTTVDRIVFGFRRVLSRAPSARERQLLEELFAYSRARYEASPDDARAVASHGQAPRLDTVDPVAVAAWSAVATALLNSDEAVTRE